MTVEVKVDGREGKAMTKDDLTDERWKKRIDDDSASWPKVEQGRWEWYAMATRKRW